MRIHLVLTGLFALILIQAYAIQDGRKLAMHPSKKSKELIHPPIQKEKIQLARSVNLSNKVQTDVLSGKFIFSPETKPELLSAFATVHVTSFELSKPPRSVQDCNGGIPVCSNTYSETNTYPGSGLVSPEDPDGGSCLKSSELNSVWYIFTVETSGNLGFQIVAKATDPAFDYDWALFNITTNGCSGITAPAGSPGVSPIVSCNYSLAGGTTGTSILGIGNSNGSADPNQNALLPVVAGETYALLVSNFTGGGSGYDLNFNAPGNSSSIIDVTPPTYGAIVGTVPCSASVIEFTLSEPVVCTSITGGEYSITGPAGFTTTATASGNTCPGTTTTIKLTLTTPLAYNTGPFTIIAEPPSAANGMNVVLDACGNQQAVGQTLTFTTGPCAVCVLGGGTIGSNQTICNTGDPLPFKNVQSPTGGLGAWTYEWEKSDNCSGIWTVIPGANLLTYDAPAGLTQNTCFRRKGINTCNATIVYSNTITVTYSATSSATSTFSFKSPVCIGANDTIKYTGSGLPTSIYSWDFGGGAIISGSNRGPYVIKWDSSGVKSVSLAVTEGGCTSALTSNNLTVNELPLANFVSTGPVCVGANDTISYTGTAPPSAIYNWGFDGGTIYSGSGQGPFEINWPSSGIKNISLTVIDGGCSSLIGRQVETVNPIPVSSFSVVPQVCIQLNSNIVFTGTVLAGSTYNWDFDGAELVQGSGKGPYTVFWDTAGTKNVSLTVISKDGCPSVPLIQQVVVNPLPVAVFSAPEKTCVGDPVSVVFEGISGLNTLFNWNFGNDALPQNATALGPHQVSWNSAGIKEIELTINDFGCQSPLTSTFVEVLPSPVADFSANYPLPGSFLFNKNVAVNFNQNSTNATTYAWDFGDGATSNDPAPSHTYLQAGTYYIELVVTNENLCSTSISKGPLTVLSNIFPVEVFSPNGDGINDVFVIDTYGIKSYSINIYNRWGEMIFEGISTNQWNGTYSNGEPVLQGVYVYQLKAFTDEGEGISKTGTISVIR